MKENRKKVGNEISLMVDIETLSTGVDAVITEIGVVAFLDDGSVVDRFAVELLVSDQIEVFGREIDAGTVGWYAKQGLAPSGFADGVGLVEGMRLFCHFVNKFEGVEIWVNGASFDFPILESAIEQCNLSLPWRYWQQNDLRSVVKLAERLSGEKVEKTKNNHTALGDAENQVDWLVQARNLLIGEKVGSLFGGELESGCGVTRGVIIDPYSRVEMAKKVLALLCDEEGDRADVCLSVVDLVAGEVLS